MNKNDFNPGISSHSARKIEESSSRFQVIMLIFILTTTLGTTYALWRGTQLLQALRSAQLQAAGIIKNGHPSELIDFIKTTIDTWPDRLALFEPGADAALRSLLAVVTSFCFLYFLRRAPKGRDLEATAYASTKKADVLARAKSLAAYDGRLLERIDGKAQAISYKKEIYLPKILCQMLDRRLEKHAAEKIAFVVVHEKAHDRSLDNALWSLGTINSLVVIGLVSALLGQVISLAAIIIVPDAVVQSIPYEAAIGIAAILFAIALSLVSAAITGVVTNLTAAREYFADAAAGAIIGRQYLPYVNADHPSRVGTIAEPWRLGAADADRRLHVREVFPRTGALVASGIALWATVRAILMFSNGGYLWEQIVFDAIAVMCLCFFFVLMPVRSEGARDYTTLPFVIALITIGLLGGVPSVIDAFAARFSVLPPFPISWLLNLVLPPLVVLCGLMVALNRRKRHNPGLEGIDWHPPRFVLTIPMLFILGAPAWTVSFVLAGLCIFTLSNVGVSVLLGASWSDSIGVVNVSTAFVLGLLAALLAKNLKRPSMISILAEIILSFFMLLGLYYFSSIMVDVAAASGGVLRYDAILAQAMAFDRSHFPSFLTAFGVCLVLLLSWVSRFHFKRWQVGVQ